MAGVQIGGNDPQALLHVGSGGTPTYAGADDAFIQNNLEVSGIIHGSLLGLGVGDPTGQLHISAGSATAGTAPIKLTLGTLNTTAEAGSIEFADNTLYFSPSDATRHRLVTEDETNSTKIGSGTQTGSYGLQSGNSANDFGLYGAISHSAGQFSSAGDAQKIELVARRETTNNTSTELFLDGSSARCVLQNDSTYLFEVLVSARRTDANGESAIFELKGGIDRDANAASTALVGSVFKTILARDNAVWDVTITADTTNGSLNVNVTGENSKTIRWVAWMRLVKTSG